MRERGERRREREIERERGGEEREMVLNEKRKKKIQLSYIKGHNRISVQK